jgi:hypothetical protein
MAPPGVDRGVGSGDGLNGRQYVSGAVLAVDAIAAEHLLRSGRAGLEMRLICRRCGASCPVPTTASRDL